MKDSIRRQNTVLTADSIFISDAVVVGKNNKFYPNVVIECQEGAKAIIGNDNTFYPGTFILATKGEIVIGNDNEFGPAGCTIRANSAGVKIEIGGGGRYSDGANIMGNTALGDGSQILGNITAQNCTLAGGGTFRESDPDRRAAVLKGFGLARNLTVETGQVINGSGNFADASVEWQRTYHPRGLK